MPFEWQLILKESSMPSKWLIWEWQLCPSKKRDQSKQAVLDWHTSPAGLRMPATSHLNWHVDRFCLIVHFLFFPLFPFFRFLLAINQLSPSTMKTWLEPTLEGRYAAHAASEDQEGQATRCLREYVNPPYGHSSISPSPSYTNISPILKEQKQHITPVASTQQQRSQG